RKVSAVHPIFDAIEPIAAHCDVSSFSCSNTMRTARSRTSGEYLVDFFIAPSSQEMEPPEKPGRFKVVSPSKQRVRRSMTIIRLGIDLAKTSFAVCGVDTHEKIVLRKTLKREKLL